VIALLVCSVLSLVLVILAQRRGSIVPFWRPREAIAASP
jgi:hypothetical protein